MTPGVDWPAGHRFAFTVFDDPDAQSLDVSREVYALLGDLGFRTTKAVWLLEPPERNSPGETCASLDFREFNRALQRKGFEIAYHNGAPGTLERQDVIRSLDLFREYFGTDPASMANHYNGDAIYWGDARLSGPVRAMYNLVSRCTGCTKTPKYARYPPDVCRIESDAKACTVALRSSLSCSSSNR